MFCYSALLIAVLSLRCAQAAALPSDAFTSNSTDAAVSTDATDAILDTDAAAAEQYEYIVVGSGAGGGPLAARLALAGHKTLLIEAGDDHGLNVNYSVPAYQGKASEDPEMAWDFFVRHYADDTAQKKDFKLSYSCPDGSTYTGLNPPKGCKVKGVLYPRAGTLGGCTAHNALITIYPFQSDFDDLAALTGDSSWSADNMRKYFVRLEDVGYISTPAGLKGHGTDGWLDDSFASSEVAANDTELLDQLQGGAYAFGNRTGVPVDLNTLSLGDANSAARSRDSTEAMYSTPIAVKDGKRNGPREFIISVRDAKKADGSKKYPLYVQLNTFVTKVTFDTSKSTPKATGVNYLQGKYLYRASKLAGTAGPGVAGRVTASREVIVSAGSYNSPQLLKLSGIGPKAELKKFNIPVLKDLPGVGTNLQDHYEISVQGTLPEGFVIFDGCTFGINGATDPCLDAWKKPNRGPVTYDSPGVVVSSFMRSSQAADSNWDIFMFGVPVNFRGFFPNYSVNATIEHNWWTWNVLKAHPRSAAGSVTLRSADPLDVPDVSFNYFANGADADLEAMYEGILLGRDSFARQPVPVKEALPGQNLQSKKDVKQFIKDTAWGHHCSSTCPIGTDKDPMAVLDSSFRVRGVQGLRVVDASVYPDAPGSFTAVSTYLVSEKAADVILADAK